MTAGCVEGIHRGVAGAGSSLGSVLWRQLLETKELPQTASAPVPLGEAVLYPGLRPKQHDQQSWRGSAPLPCAGETLPGALRPDVESSVVVKKYIFENNLLTWFMNK